MSCTACRRTFRSCRGGPDPPEHLGRLVAGSLARRIVGGRPAALGRLGALGGTRVRFAEVHHASQRGGSRSPRSGDLNQLEPKWLEPKWLEPKWLRIVRSSLLCVCIFPREGTSEHKITSPRELSSYDTASDSEHLDALREDGTKLNVAILDALGFDQVECTKDSWLVFTLLENCN